MVAFIFAHNQWRLLPVVSTTQPQLTHLPPCARPCLHTHTTPHSPPHTPLHPTGASLSELSEADRFYLSDDYKAQVVSAMSTSQLIEICLINPTVTLTPSYRWEWEWEVGGVGW